MAEGRKWNWRENSRSKLEKKTKEKRPRKRKWTQARRVLEKLQEIEKEFREGKWNSRKLREKDVQKKNNAKTNRAQRSGFDFPREKANR